MLYSLFILLLAQPIFIKTGPKKIDKATIISQRSIVFGLSMHYKENKKNSLHFLCPNKTTISLLLQYFNHQDIKIQKHPKCNTSKLQLNIDAIQDSIIQDNLRICIELHDCKLIIYKRTGQCFAVPTKTLFLPKEKID